MAVAREIALRLLTVRARTRAELERALAQRGVPDEAVGEVLGRFAAVGLIDDSDFSRAWVESRQRAGRSTRVIRQELRAKGVSDDDAAGALAAVDPASDRNAAHDFATRRLRSLQGVDRSVRYRRLAGALARRGFPSGVIADVLREVLADGGAHAEDADDGFDR